MKKNFFKKFTVFLGLISCCLPKDNNFKKMNAEEEINYQEIGYLFNVSRVTTETKIYITASERALISEAGREIFMEEVLEYGTLSNLNEPNGPISPKKFKYYYIADATHGIISNKVLLTNSYASFANAVHYLENAAKDYGLTRRDQTLNYIFEFIRTINKNYNEESFQTIMGHSSDISNFINYVNNANHGGMKIVEYFASFIDEASYNANLHGEIRNDYLTNNYYLHNAFENDANIDLLHMVATIDGSFINTGTSGFASTQLSKMTFACLSGWAGDLQSTCFDMAKPTNSFDDFNFERDVLESNTKFPYSDFYADIDGYNISYALNTNDELTFSEAIRTYYRKSIDSNFNQIHEFVELTLARCDYKDLSDIEKFKTLVYSLMAINYKDGNISDCGAFSLGQLLKYSLLTDSFPAKKSKLPKIEIRLLFSNGFIDLVLMKGGYYD